MKKFLAIIAIASFAVACNNESSTSEATENAANVIDSTANAAKESMNNMADSAGNLIDSTAKAAVDTVKSKM